MVLQEALEIVNAWGWADRIFHYHTHEKGFAFVFQLSQECYERELAQAKQDLPLAMQQEARIKELTTKIRALEDELSEAKKNTKAPEKGQTSLL